MNQYETYYKIIELIDTISLEDKEALADELNVIIDKEIEAQPYKPDHNDDLRATELRVLTNRL